MKKQILGAFLLMVVLSASVYFVLPGKVRIDIGKTNTQYSVWENDDWTLAATEYVNLYDGSTKMRAKSRVLENYSIGNMFYEKRVSIWKDNIKTIQTYGFDILNRDVEQFPVSNEFECFNCKDKIVHYEIRDILYNGKTTNIESPFSFGNNMKIEWGMEDFSWAKVYQQKVSSDKIIVRYVPNQDYEKYSVRLYDPVNTTIPSSYACVDISGTACSIPVNATGGPEKAVDGDPNTWFTMAYGDYPIFDYYANFTSIGSWYSGMNFTLETFPTGDPTGDYGPIYLNMTYDLPSDCVIGGELSVKVRVSVPSIWRSNHTFYCYNYSEGLYSEELGNYRSEQFNVRSGMIDFVLNYIPSIYVDFNISISENTFLEFSPSNLTHHQVVPINQTNITGVFTSENKLSGDISVWAKLNNTNPNITMKIGNSSNYSNSISINNSYQQLYNNLSIGSTSFLWAWADYNNPSEEWYPELEIKGVFLDG